jgi:hypothetical protein
VPIQFFEKLEGILIRPWRADQALQQVADKTQRWLFSKQPFCLAANSSCFGDFHLVIGSASDRANNGKAGRSKTFRGIREIKQKKTRPQRAGGVLSR